MYRHASAQAVIRLTLLFRAVEVWLVISAIEVIHGVARVALLEPFVGDFQARQLGVLSGSILILVTTFVFRRWLTAKSVRDCLIVGGVWVGLTLTLEFALGRMMMGLSWNRILSDYDLLRGGLMPVGLLVMFLSPLIAVHFWGENRSSSRQT
jgi:hypothetical protein